MSELHRADRPTKGVMALAAAALLFAGVRLLLLARRGPDIDELFTVWLVRKSPLAILETLRHDSGPPLYYWLLSLLPGGWTTLHAVQLVSVAFAIVTMVVVVRAAGGAAGAMAGALLALYPQHVYFSTMGRAYALVALLVGVAAVASDRWCESGERRMLFAACVAIAAAAYSHYYGLYFVPLPLCMALVTRRTRWRDGAIATAVLALVLAPTVLLMTRQPQDAIAWMRIDDDLLRVIVVLQSVLRIGFDGRQMLPSGTEVVRTVSVAMLLAALYFTRRSPRATRYLVAIALPIAGATFAAAIGLTAYFPLRFESILSVPVVLWIWFAAAEARREIRAAIIGGALAIGLIATASMLAQDHSNRSPVYRAATLVTRAPAGESIVATGKVFMEASALGGRAVIPFPRRHDVHPTLPIAMTEIEADARRLPDSFVWAGEIDGPAVGVLLRTFDVRPIARFDGVIVARCSRRRG